MIVKGYLSWKGPATPVTFHNGAEVYEAEWKKYLIDNEEKRREFYKESRVDLDNLPDKITDCYYLGGFESAVNVSHCLKFH